MDLLFFSFVGAFLGAAPVAAILWWALCWKGLKVKPGEGNAVRPGLDRKEQVSEPARTLDPLLELAHLRGAVMRILEKVQELETVAAAILSKQKEGLSLEADEELRSTMGGLGSGLRSMAEQLGRQEADLRNHLDSKIKVIQSDISGVLAKEEGVEEVLRLVEVGQVRLLDEVRSIATSIESSELPSGDEARAIATLISVGRYGEDVGQLLQSAGELVGAQEIATARDLRAQLWGHVLAVVGGPTSRNTSRSDLIQMMSRLCSVLARLGADGRVSMWREFADIVSRVAEGRFQQRLAFAIPGVGETFNPASMNAIGDHEGVVVEIVELGLIDLHRGKEVVRKATVRLGQADL